MMRRHVGKQGIALNFKVAPNFPGGLGVRLVWKPRSCGVRLCRSFRAMELPGLHKGQRSRSPEERVQVAYYCKRDLVPTEYHRRPRSISQNRHQMEYRDLKHKPVQHR